MPVSTPFYLDNLDALRTKLARAEQDGTRMGEVWSTMRRRVRVAPKSFPWFTPFTAMITQDPADIESARQAIRRYVSTFEAQSFGMGLQFHFWCFSFPHARWALYFQWLDSIGAWEPAEAKHLRETLISFQFVNFFYGMRTKPEPACVDNQSLSLCFSNALIGKLFGDEANGGSALCDRMARDGFRRLPSMLGGFPPSGYSGEGSTYMDHVVGPCIPFVVELLERHLGGDWYGQELAPNGGSAAAVVRMIAREWTPSGLTLPWDHYGFDLPTRSCIAYGAYKTGEPLYHELLAKHADWCHDMSVGWGVDDLVWSLIWWPSEQPDSSTQPFPSWAEPTVGAALVSDDADLYLMQMWDETNPGYPTRAHVNPNSLIFTAYGSPLSIDGVPENGSTLFNYEDTWKEIGNADFAAKKTNYGNGCAGSHSVLIVDGWEGMRALTHYNQADMVDFDAASRSVCADVTPLYKEHWPDARRIRRRSRLVANRFWLVEDLAQFDAEHAVTARFYLRPSLVPQPAGVPGVCIETLEGVRLWLQPLVGPDTGSATLVQGYPNRLDGASLRVDRTQRGSECRWLWLAFPQATRRVANSVADSWQCVADPMDDAGQGGWDLAAASAALATGSATTLAFTRPAFMLSDDLAPAKRWWYRRRITVPATGGWLRLPRGLVDAALWIDGRQVDLAAWRMPMALLAPQIPVPAGEHEILVRTDCGTAQYDAARTYGSGFSGDPVVLEPIPGLAPPRATWTAGTVQVSCGADAWTAAHALMEAGG